MMKKYLLEIHLIQMKNLLSHLAFEKEFIMNKFQKRNSLLMNFEKRIKINSISLDFIILLEYLYTTRIKNRKKIILVKVFIRNLR